MFIVQLFENHEFLCPSVDGDVTSTPWLKRAGVFKQEISAIETADFYIGAGHYLIVDLRDFKPTDCDQ